jgi:hypothetical protein
MLLAVENNLFPFPGAFAKQQHIRHSFVMSARSAHRHGTARVSLHGCLRNFILGFFLELTNEIQF